MMPSLLRDYQVRHLHLSPLVTVHEDQPIRDVIAQMQTYRIGCVLVCAQDRLTGIVTEMDVLRKVESGGDSVEDPVSSIMTRNPVCIAQDASIWEAAEKMNEGGFRHLPVVDAQGAPQGYISIRSLVIYLADQFPDTIYTLPPDPHRFPSTPEGP
ncbi:MAG: CBS domain-containing protein [Nitrospirae bacterium]|nr:MAG: CBS domain-containing protein [Nitrospirota bacterium]